ncbi:MAG: hypothetical protein AMXMBFR84_03410 [Candidatus Hydrogenedentota bacterium]
MPDPQSTRRPTDFRSRITWDWVVLVCCAMVATAAAGYQLLWNPSDGLSGSLLLRKLFLPGLLWVLAADQFFTGKRRFLNGAARRRGREK